MLLLSFVALAAKPAPVPWPTTAAGDPLQIAVLGELSADPDQVAALARDVLARKPDLVVFTGLDTKADLSVWAGDHGIVASSRSNPNGGFLKRFPGIGVDGRATPYGALDVTAADTRWRLLYATTWPGPLARWNEQLFWLPKGADPTSYDRLLVLLDSPVHTASDRVGQPGARIVVDDVQDVTKPIAMPLVIAGNTGTNEAYLPGGTFGELHLVAGNSGGRKSEVSPMGGGFVQPPDPAPGSEVLRGGVLTGYWWVELHGSNVDLSFLNAEAGAWKPIYRVLRDGTGWHLPAATEPTVP